ncbi:MAG TPA: tetratricopeptide repeat protein [Nitrospirae bacterium]|nr:tetratricopeptide repeat protein [Nitrospirota bacterium]
MPLEPYKKWAVAIIVAAAAGFFVVSLVTSPSFRTKEPARERTGMTSPPLEEAGVDMENPQSLALLGEEYFESKRYAQAVEIYKQALELSPTDVDIYNDLGLAYHYSGQPVLAVDTLKKGTEVMPSYQRIWLSLGYVLMSTGKDEEARQALEKAAGLNPGSDVGQEAERMLGLLK